MPLTSIIWREKTEKLRHQSDPTDLIICFHYYPNEHKLKQVQKLTFMTLSSKSFWTKIANLFLSITPIDIFLTILTDDQPPWL